MIHRLSFLLITLALVHLTVLVIYPVSSTLTKSGMLLSFLGLWLGLVIQVWKRVPLRWGLILLPVILAMPLLQPSPPIDQVKLREDYVKRMEAFTDTPYYWVGKVPVALIALASHVVH